MQSGIYILLYVHFLSHINKLSLGKKDNYKNKLSTKFTIERDCLILEKLSEVLINNYVWILEKPARLDINFNKNYLF